jgi:hypothetical protein
VDLTLVEEDLQAGVGVGHRPEDREPDLDQRSRTTLIARRALRLR